MKRKVSICTLCASTAQSAADYLKQRVSEYSSDVPFNDFGDAAAFAAGVDSCALEGGVIFAAAPVSLFLNAKLRLIKTVSSKIVRSNSITAAMGENAPDDPKIRDLHAAIPEKSKALKSADGLYSAFLKEHGNGLIVFLPLDEERLCYLFGAGLARLLDGIFQKTTAPVSDKPKLSALKEHVESVIKSGKTVAISPCGCSKALVSAISAVPECETAFVQDAALRDRLADEAIENYVAECAKISKESAKTDFGVSVSPIYNDKTDGSDFIVVCVADSERAKAAKVYSNPGEEKKYLVAAAVIKLCEMLGEISPAGLVNPNLPAKKEKKWAKNPKLPIIITSIALAIAVIIGIIVAVALGGDKQTETKLPGTGIYDYYQQEDYYEDINYYGGSNIDKLEMQAQALQTEASTAAETTTESTVTQTLTQVLTTIKNVVTTKKLTTTQKITTTKNITTTEKLTTTKATTTLKPTTTKITTTLKPTTTLKETTTLSSAANTTGSTTAASSVTGTFVFKVYGFGHGVGMSQDGAIQMAKDGKSYEEILTHYYTGTTVKTDSATPLTIRYGGKDIPIVEYLCRTTKREIGASAPMEALKAQVVTAYTFAKDEDFDVPASKHAYDSSYEYKGTNIHKACLAVLGMTADTDTPHAKYVDYNGEAAFTCYFASAAGKTASSDSVWGGGEKYPHLKGGVSSPETIDVSEKKITAEEMKKYILTYAEDNDLEITLSDNPAEWIEIVSHDSSVNENVGYATSVRIGNKQVRGNVFRCYVLDFAIRSHCFTFEYIPA
ncbi:MAG: hypothetical protein IJE74_09140 [Clostridia bacterium]|nr:hypothetical protein [Clostridia bacterium]